MLTKSAAELYASAFNDGLRPDPILTLSNWADEHRILPKESSKESGRYRTDRTPYLREPMDVLSPTSPVQHVVVIKGTQLGWTTVAENLLFMVAHLYPGPCLAVLPTTDLLKRFSQNRITPALREMRCLDGKIKNSRVRDSGNTIEQKRFPGGSWRFATSNSGPALRSDPIRYLVLDDRDGFDLDVGGEGEPGEIAKKRTDTFSVNKKIYENSTPTEKGISRIEKSFEQSSQAYFYLACPSCGNRFKMGLENWSQLKYRLDGAGGIRSESVYWECESCGGEIREHHKTAMLRGGEWVHTYPDRAIRGYSLPSLYSPVGWVSWAQVADEYVKAELAMKRKDPSLMKVWTNTRMAETWEEALDGADTHQLYERREKYGPTIPMDGLVLTAAVDVQDDRIECEVIAWGFGYENWGVDYKVFEGSPVEWSVWEQLDEYLVKRHVHESGWRLRIQATAIDCGYLTTEVYRFCGPRWRRGVFAVKGATPGGAAARPIVSVQPVVDNKYEARRFLVGTDTAKDQWTRWLTLTEDGPGRCHFPAYYTPEWFGMVTAEKVRKRYVKGYAVREWVKVSPHARNEALDIRVYNLAAVMWLKPSFGAIRRKLVADLSVSDEHKPEKTADPEPQKKPARKKRRNRRSAGFVSGWK